MPKPFDGACKLKLNGLLELLRSLVEDPIYRKADYQPERIRLFKREIRYPLVTPVVTTLSQHYFCIVTELNLLCVPLTEGRFLLPPAGPLHELAHPLLIEQDDPLVEPMRAALFLAVRDALGYLAEELAKEDRRRGPIQPTFMLQRWEIAWVKSLSTPSGPRSSGPTCTSRRSVAGIRSASRS